MVNCVHVTFCPGTIKQINLLGEPERAPLLRENDTVVHA